ncbi:MAG: EamA family transporter [Desulfobacter sp.]|nr:EamA family transporter [Desulfobacter sp.]
MKTNSIFKGYIFILTAAVLFGTTGTAQMLGAKSISSWVIGAFRLIIGGPLLLAFASGRKQAVPGHNSFLVLVASIGVVLFQFTFFAAVARTGVATATLVSIGSSPIIAGILGALFFKEPLGKPWTMAALLSVAGCFFLVSSGNGMIIDAKGMGLALAAGTGYAVYVVAGRGLAGQMPPAKTVGMILSWGALMMIPFLGFADLKELANPRVMLTLCYMGVFPTALSYFLLARGLGAVPIASAAVLLLVEPLVGALLGIWILGEPLTLNSGIGMVLIFSGMAVIVMKQIPSSISLVPTILQNKK